MDQSVVQPSLLIRVNGSSILRTSNLNRWPDIAHSVSASDAFPGNLEYDRRKQLPISQIMYDQTLKKFAVLILVGEI